MNKKTFMLVWFETFLLISILLVTASNSFTIHKNPTVKANLFLFIEKATTLNGLSSCMVFQIGNTITDIGEQYNRNIIGFNNVTAHNATGYIAWGNCTITQTKTILDAEATTACFNRSNPITPVAWDNSGDYAFNLTLSVIANATININACSVHWDPTASSNNNMFALAGLPQATTANSGDNFTAVWVFTFDFN